MKNKFELSLIKEVFETTFPELKFDDFEIALKQAIKKIKAEKKAIELEKAKIKEIFCVLQPSDDMTDQELIELDAEENDWYDKFSDIGGGNFPDEGVQDTEYYLIGDNLYEVELHCDAEWIGDWSVRANVPSTVSVIKVTQITDFSFIIREDEYAQIKLA